jgi:hypothetical protein
MQKMKNNTDLIIDQIQKVRSKNNKLWMDLLRVASQYAPDRTKKILKAINTNDKKISKLIGEIK